jgi:hypothetical protein
MPWPGAAELAVLILTIGLIWVAGVAWIRLADHIETGRAAGASRR